MQSTLRRTKPSSKRWEGMKATRIIQLLLVSTVSAVVTDLGW